MRLSATRQVSHALTSECSQPTAFSEIWIGEGNEPVAMSRYIDDRLRPVKCCTSGRRMIRSWLDRDSADRELQVQCESLLDWLVGPGFLTDCLDADDFIVAVLGSAGIGGDGYGILCTHRCCTKGG